MQVLKYGLLESMAWVPQLELSKTILSVLLCLYNILSYIHTRQNVRSSCFLPHQGQRDTGDEVVGSEYSWNKRKQVTTCLPIFGHYGLNG